MAHSEPAVQMQYSCVALFKCNAITIRIISCKANGVIRRVIVVFVVHGVMQVLLLLSRFGRRLYPSEPYAICLINRDTGAK